MPAAVGDETIWKQKHHLGANTAKLKVRYLINKPPAAGRLTFETFLWQAMQPMAKVGFPAYQAFFMSIAVWRVGNHPRCGRGTGHMILQGARATHIASQPLTSLIRPLVPALSHLHSLASTATYDLHLPRSARHHKYRHHEAHLLPHRPHRLDRNGSAALRGQGSECRQPGRASGYWMRSWAGGILHNFKRNELI